MQNFEEDEESFDGETGDDALSFDEEEDEDDPKGAAFIRGEQDAVKIHDEPEEGA